MTTIKKWFFVAILATIAIGTIGYGLLEPEAKWYECLLWGMFGVLRTVRIRSTSPTSELFQTSYLLITSLLAITIAAVLVPPFISAWNAERKGEGRIRRNNGRMTYLLVGPVDWEKVMSVHDQIKKEIENFLFLAMTGEWLPDKMLRVGANEDPKNFLLVVVAENLPDMPAHLQKAGIRYVKGCLRKRETYARAGLEWARGAFVCAPTYNNPNEADSTTSAIVRLIERWRPEIRTVVEGVSHDNECFFSGTGFTADHIVWFDPVILNEVAINLAIIELARDEKTPVSISYNCCDEQQAAELERQIKMVGAKSEPDGMPIRIILPTNLDDPSKSDFITHAAILQAQQENVAFVALYLSVESRDLFADLDGGRVLCADEIMAKTLVEAMLSDTQNQ